MIFFLLFLLLFSNPAFATSSKSEEEFLEEQVSSPREAWMEEQMAEEMGRQRQENAASHNSWDAFKASLKRAKQTLFDSPEGGIREDLNHLK